MGWSDDKDFLGRLSVDLSETPSSSWTRIGVASMGHDHGFGFFLERILEERCLRKVEKSWWRKGSYRIFGENKTENVPQISFFRANSSVDSLILLDLQNTKILHAKLFCSPYSLFEDSANSAVINFCLGNWRADWPKKRRANFSSTKTGRKRNELARKRVEEDGRN